MRGFIRALGSTAAACALLVPGVARAAEPAAEPTSEQKAAATVLFREARALMERGDIPPACRRFEESQRLDPLPGTLLNVAVCHEKEGRTATAWVEFRDGAALARRDGRDDRVALAEEHMRALEPRLSNVRIVVGRGADVPGLVVLLDGTGLDRPAWDTPLPVDPGAHVVKATAPGKKALEVKLQTDGSPGTRAVPIDALEDAPPPPLAPEVAPPPLVSEAPRANETGPRPRSETAPSSRRIAALVVGGAAVVGIGVGTGFGIDAISKHAASNRSCPSNQCNQAGVTANDESGKSADISTVAFAVALPAAAVAAYLWLSGGRPAPATALRVVPLVGPMGAGVTVGRAF